ncbi:MAG: FAD-binding oxidoreductase [Chloroflexi bacterium]|nr:FAD-binding oxidoreductase [Chloroflexota bacterium]MDA1271770.1 FAD-binding oxidoreductase [Chloroflexota bacterium]PKB59391.1 MAG: hypothetical protein BZY83_01985 [SAR202 cluster bacterium Casp-Chloro-G2]
MESSLGDSLVRLLGANSVLPVVDGNVDGRTPQVVVRPRDRVQISEFLSWASSEKVSVLPRGGGTRMGLGNVPRSADVVLDLSRLDRVVDYQPADMTATVEAGVTLASLQERLAPGGEFVPLESALPGRSTVGGTLSVGAGGPLAQAYGLPREWLIGISVLSPLGVATKAGGKVVKNVTGYDLNKLYTGSLGTLGVIVEASFKLLPIDPESGALLVSFPSLLDSVLAGRKLVRSPAGPLGYHGMTFGVFRRLQDSIQAASQGLGLGDTDAALSLAFYSGRAKATGRRMGEAAALLLSEGATAVQRVEGPAAQGLLRWIGDVPSEISPRSVLVMRLSVQPQSAARASVECGEVTLSGGKPDQIADPGFGAIRLFWPTPTDVPSAGGFVPGVRAAGLAQQQPILDAINRTQQVAKKYGGSAVVEHCPLHVKGQIDVWGDAPDSMAVMRRLKDKFDPGGMLNPGRFLGGI